MLFCVIQNKKHFGTRSICKHCAKQANTSVCPMPMANHQYLPDYTISSNTKSLLPANKKLLRICLFGCESLSVFTFSFSVSLAVHLFFTPHLPLIFHLFATYRHRDLIETSSRPHRDFIVTSSYDHRMIAVTSPYDYRDTKRTSPRDTPPPV